MTQLYTIVNFIILIIYFTLIMNITIKILTKRHTVPSTTAWLLGIYIVPLLGIIIYFLFGEYKLEKDRIKRSKKIFFSSLQWMKLLKDHYKYEFSQGSNEAAHLLFQLCKNRQGIGALKGNHTRLLDNSSHIIELLIQDINAAKKNIEMVFYIWQIGGLVDKVAEALMAAAKRGVCCRLMLDSAGSIDFFRSFYPIIMRQSGINIVEALHLNLFQIFFRRMDLRQHRKMVLIDSHICYIGSMNMIDPFLFKRKSGVGQWIDMMIRIEGPVTAAMRIIYSHDWALETGEYIFPPVISVSNMHLPIPIKNSGSIIQIIASGPEFTDGLIHQALLIAIHTARKKLVITTPYLVPSDDLLYAICTAAQRGIEVHIIIPKKNDSVLVKWASRAFFTELLSAGVLIHQFEGGLLHTKSILIDGQLSLIGTLNLDMRSLWLNLEIAVIIDNIDFSNNLFQIQQNYIKNSKIINPIEWSNRPYWQRIFEGIFYMFSPLL
ncbi:cardiolipin synthase [Candidatus Schneideria nysicola]|uniref:cardiolipin synthase n=1 Tax=Candidatus Schneideria nysicola TaxID=1081631 RepID=UPI001CAA707C|nr:cardiolipin synthase [Candidatus Schneideria nysicola]UAJ66202.1 cardiolipin synthase [Candidatus Schneideria nysicola]